MSFGPQGGKWLHFPGLESLVGKSKANPSTRRAENGYTFRIKLKMAIFRNAKSLGAVVTG